MKLTTEFLDAKHTALGPAWRYQLGKELISGNLRIAGCPDTALQNFIDYLAALERPGGEDSAAAAFPAIAAALVINSDTALVAQLKVMVLGRLGTAEICSRTKLAPEALAAWKALFFDVEEDLAATSWIVQHIFSPEREAGRRDFAEKLTLAFRGGPDAARLALSLDEGLPVPNAARLEREELQLALKRDQALNMPVTTPGEGLRWIKLDLERRRAEQRLALERQKFEFQCAQVLRRHEDREKQAAEKAQQRALEDHRRTERHQQLRAQAALRAASSPLAQLTWANSANQVASRALPAAIRLAHPADSQEPGAAASNVLLAGTLPVEPSSRFQKPARLSA